jgi:uncharacterized protein YccT (UPF0319 family)
MTSLWTKYNDATQPGPSATKEAIAEVAAALNYAGKEPPLYVMKRAQRLAQMKGQSIRESNFRYWFDQAVNNLAAQFGVAK